MFVYIDFRTFNNFSLVVDGRNKFHTFLRNSDLRFPMLTSEQPGQKAAQQIQGFAVEGELWIQGFC